MFNNTENSSGGGVQDYEINPSGDERLGNSINSMIDVEMGIESEAVDAGGNQ